MKKLLCSVSFLLAVSCGFAQSAAGSSKDVTPENVGTTPVVQNQSVDVQDTVSQSKRGIPMPQNIGKLIEQGNDVQAIEEFSKFKKKQRRADKFHMAYLEMTLYRDLSFFCPSKSEQYSSLAKSLVDQMVQDFPDVSDVYLLQIQPESTPEEIIDLTTKAIDSDPENISAYEMRARALFQLGKTEEGCLDFGKLPHKNQMPEYWQCEKK